MRDCAEKCFLKEENCKQRECRLWLDYPEDHNCTLIAVKKHGPMTLREIAERHGVSIVRIKQIADKALLKIKSVVNRDEY